MSREGGSKNTKTLRKKMSRGEKPSSLVGDGAAGNNAAPPVVAEGDVDINLPPGRMHAVKGHHRLQGSSGSGMETFGQAGGGGGSTSSAPGTPRSRSRSPSLRGTGGGGDGKVTMSTADANSSISSFDDLDRDILTDRAGIMDDLSESQRKLHSSKEFHLPATVNERLCDDSLEDSHAFSDVGVRSSNCSRVSMRSGSNGDAMLEPLDECEEGLEENSFEGEDDEFDENGDANNTTTVILTNMENLNLQQDPHPGAGESLQGEAPSAPTA